MSKQAEVRVEAIEAAAGAALRALELCQAARALNKAGAEASMFGAIQAAGHACTEAQAQLSIVAESL